MQSIPSKLLVRVNSMMFPLLNYRLYSSKQTLYDVLNLKRTCTEQEIRNAFLKLSKENHPDMKGTAGGSRADNQKFIAILQAYQVLSKKDLRGQYDLDLQASERRSAYADKATHDMRQQNQYMRYGDFTPASDPNPGPYYGVKGISKVSNLNIAAILFGIAILGTALQFFLIRDALDEFSKEAGEKHANVRADAEKYGNEKQLERLAEKFLQGNSR